MRNVICCLEAHRYLNQIFQAKNCSYNNGSPEIFIVIRNGKTMKTSRVVCFQVL